MPRLTLFVDVGNVLLSFDKSIAFRSLAGLCGKSPLEVESLLSDLSLENDFETGTLDANAFADELRNALDSSASNDELERAWSPIFAKNGKIPSQIASMCTAHEVPIELFSDTDPWRAKEMERLLERPFPRDTVRRTYSFAEKALKRDGVSLRRAKIRIGHRNEAILLDDIKENVVAATRAGIRGVLFDGDISLEFVGVILKREHGAIKEDEMVRVARAIEIASQIAQIAEAARNSGVHHAQTRIERVFAECGVTDHYRPLIGGKIDHRVNQKAIRLMEDVLSALGKEFSGSPSVPLSDKEVVRVGDEAIRRVRGRVSRILAEHYATSLAGSQGVKFFGNPCAPLIARSHWLPASLVSVDEIDARLEWVSQHKPSVPLFPLFQVRRERMMERYNDENEVNQRARNDVTYRLIEVGESRGLPRLTFAESRYAAYVDTCEAYLLEAARAYVSSGSQMTRDLLKRCKWREQLGDIFDLKNRDACAGINTLCIIADDEGDMWLLHKREGTMEAAGLLHVLPAGTFQPFMEGDQDHKFEFRLHSNVFREFCEEVLCKEKEMQELRRNGSSAITMREFYESPHLKQTSRIYAPFFKGKLGSHWFLGLGLDVCTLKPEILTVLIINRKALCEIVPQIPMTNLEGQYLYKPFDREALESFVHSIDDEGESAHPMLAAGSAAIARVLDPTIWPAISSEVDRVRGLSLRE